MTHAEIQLSPGFRVAQRAMALWLEHAGASARRQAFVARGTLSALTPSEQGRLARWLAWVCVAACSRGLPSPIARIHRLDSSLYARVDAALDLLPAMGAIAEAAHRLSA